MNPRESLNTRGHRQKKSNRRPGWIFNLVVLTRRHETDCGCNVGEPTIISTNGRILA